MKIHSYKALVVWQKAVKLATIIYQLTEYFPKSELYGMTSQIRRASVSIPSNIAEGRSRKTRKDFAYFLSIAHGSLAELETQIEIARRLPYGYEIDFSKCDDLIKQIRAMLGSMIRKLNPITS